AASRGRRAVRGARARATAAASRRSSGWARRWGRASRSCTGSVPSWAAPRCNRRARHGGVRKPRRGGKKASRRRRRPRWGVTTLDRMASLPLWARFAGAAVAVGVATAVAALYGADVAQAALFLLVAVLVAALGGRRVGVATAIVAALVLNL